MRKNSLVLCARRSKEYLVFAQAEKRCNNPNDRDYRNYGGRGIKFLFDYFDDIIREIGHRPDNNRHFDRIDNSGHYAAGNVRWATHHESQLNKRTKKAIESFTDAEILEEVKRRGIAL